MSWTATPQSSTIAGFDYDKATQVLTVEFKSGGRYNYYDVPMAVFEGLVAANSKGQFHAQNIKNSYRYARV
jgi:hypothetical protein